MMISMMLDLDLGGGQDAYLLATVSGDGKVLADNANHHNNDNISNK